MYYMLPKKHIITQQYQVMQNQAEFDQDMVQEALINELEQSQIQCEDLFKDNTFQCSLSLNNFFQAQKAFSLFNKNLSPPMGYISNHEISDRIDSIKNAREENQLELDLLMEHFKKLQTKHDKEIHQLNQLESIIEEDIQKKQNKEQQLSLISQALDLEKDALMVKKYKEKAALLEQELKQMDEVILNKQQEHEALSTQLHEWQNTKETVHSLQLKMDQEALHLVQYESLLNQTESDLLLDPRQIALKRVGNTQIKKDYDLREFVLVFLLSFLCVGLINKIRFKPKQKQRIQRADQVHDLTGLKHLFTLNIDP